MPRTARTLLAAILALAAFAASAIVAAEAKAAPALDVSVTGQSSVLVPEQNADYDVLIRNTGDTPTSGTVTVTVTMPAGVTALSAADTSGFGIWACTVAPGGATVTCTGPNLLTSIPPGGDVCSGNFLPACPIRVAAKAGTQKAAGTLTAEACGGNAPQCGTGTLDVHVQDFGDDYGIASINQPGADTVSVIPETKAFWAGACDRTAAPAFGEPIPAPGTGSRPSSIWAPADESANLSANRIQVPAPATVPHCIDLGEPSQYMTSEPGIWFQAPDWRLPAQAQAGSHPDGTSKMAWKRNADNRVDGAVDNIYVNLPPGFVGNPNALEKCTQEQFATEPPKCSPASQAGILHLLIQARSFGAAGHGPGGNYRIHPVWNLEPRKGRVAELGFAYASGESAVSVRVSAKARTNGDFGVTAFTGQIPAALSPVIQTITLWGVPWDSANDIWRAPAELRAGDTSRDPCTRQDGVYAVSYVPHSGFSSECRESYDPSWGEVQPFVSQETDCNASPVVDGGTDAYQNPGGFVSDGGPAAGKLNFLTADPNPADGDWKTAKSDQAPVTGCEKLGFAPDIGFGATSSSADGATGLKVDLAVPQNNDLPFAAPPSGASQQAVDQYVADAAAHWKSDAGLATAHLKDTVVTLPPGVSVNPSAATGLTGCDDATVGVRQQGDPPLFDNSDPTDGLHGDDCPAGSRLGTARVDTPLLDEPLTGDVILGTPKSTDPQSGEMLRMFLVLRDKERGLIAKVYGSATADPNTGRLTATFRNNPEVPFDNLKLDFKGGAKGVLAMPQSCGNPGWTAAFTPWSSVGAPVPVADRSDGGTFTVDQRCANAFAPALAAGMDTKAARSSGRFSFQFGRAEGQQYLRGLTATLPQGLLASVKDVPLCADAQANAGTCPLGSQIGIVDAKAGSGNPFVLEQKGRVYLTEGYKGGEYGLAVKIRPIAGPFRGARELSPIIVRQAIHVDRKTAQVRAVSDPFPLIHHGIPLRVREVTVKVDRNGFMLNPSDCSAKQVGAAIRSDQGTTANRSNRFQASGCAALPFEPRLAMRLVGRKQVVTGRHPAVRALVRQQGVGEAGIERAEVRLPKSLALDPANAQALCEFEDGTSAEPENRCPEGAIVGRARAVSPLLNRPLVGNVYFVKNIRIDPDTGNEIRTLPMIVAALRGEISVNLTGESSTTKAGKLVNTFADVPDAPISRFNLNIQGGRNGILAVTRTSRSRINLCRAGRQVAEADMDGQNGKRHDFNVVMRKPCGKRRQPAAKICRKRTSNRKAFRRCVGNVKKVRAKRAAAKRKANRRAAARRTRG